VGKLRIQKLDENMSVVILDFSVDNDSDRKLVVRTIDATLDGTDGSSTDGHVIASRDLLNIFKNYPELEQFNPPFKAWDEVKPHERIDRMIGMQFDVPEDKLAKRKDIDLRLEDLTGVSVHVLTK
jgi:hypothetical protein